MNNYLFIGGGNMAKAIIQGMYNSSLKNIKNQTNINQQTKQNIYVIDRNIQTHTDLKQFDCITFSSIQEVKNILQNINCIVLAIKPQDSIEVMQELAEVLNIHNSNANPDLLIISIMAGINIKTITKYLDYACVRCMPNTPLLVNMGASALVGFNISNHHKNIANSMFASSGITCWLDDEEKLHAVTAISGGAPAYVFYLLRAMQDLSIELGLPSDISRQLIAQTFAGTAQMALTIDKDLIEMQKNVMSKGGTTEQAINGFEENNIADLIQKSLLKAYNRSKEMENNN